MLSLNELDVLAFACIVWRLLTLPKCLSHSPEGWDSDESQAASRALRLKPSSARTQTDAKIRILYDLNRPQASSRINIRVGHCWSGTKSRCIFHLVQILSQQSNENNVLYTYLKLSFNNRNFTSYLNYCFQIWNKEHLWFEDILIIKF